MKIEEFKNITIAYKRNIGEYGSKNEQLMQDIKTYLETNDLLHDDTTIVGIALDNPAVTPPEKLRYDVGMILKDDIHSNLATRKVDDGSYAIFEVIHTKQDVIAFWQNISQFMANLTIDYDKPIVERYAVTKIRNHICEFCIPLK